MKKRNADSRNSSITRTSLPVLASLALMLGAGVVAAGVLADSAIALKRQKELLHLLRHDCGSCHGMTLKGGLGKPLLPENLADRDARVLAEVILDGIPGTPMPPWRGILAEREARWLAERLKQGLNAPAGREHAKSP